MDAHLAPPYPPWLAERPMNYAQVARGRMWSASGIPLAIRIVLNRRMYQQPLYYSKQIHRFPSSAHISPQFLATFACRHAPSGQRHGGGAAVTRRMAFSIKIKNHPIQCIWSIRQRWYTALERISPSEWLWKNNDAETGKESAIGKEE